MVNRYFQLVEIIEEIPSKNTRLAQQKTILNSQNYRSFGQNEHKLLSEKPRQLSKIHSQHFHIDESSEGDIRFHFEKLDEAP